MRKNIKTVQNEGGLVGFIGGPPCPDFSVAGKQKGRDGDNGKLSQSYIDLIIRQKPDFFLFENVKGLWRTAKHREDFEELKSKLAKYYLLTNRLCNALEYGAPQDRDRILLFGIRKGVAKRLGLTIKEFDWDARRLYDLSELKALPWPGAEPFINEGKKDIPAEIPEGMTVEYWFRQNDVENHLTQMIISRRGLVLSVCRQYRREMIQRRVISEYIVGVIPQLYAMETMKYTCIRTRNVGCQRLKQWRCNLFQGNLCYQLICPRN